MTGRWISKGALRPVRPGRVVAHAEGNDGTVRNGIVPTRREAILGDDAFVARFEPYRAGASREVPRREGRRALEAIFRGAVTRAARDAAIVTAFLERYALAEIARYLEVHPSTVSKVVSVHGARARKTHGFKT